MLKSSLSLAFVLLAAMTQAKAQDAAKSPLPGGASSLEETYDDWRVACGVANQTKQCVMQQQLADSKSGQRVLTVGLAPASGGGVTGRLIMPFGAALDAGVTMALDAGAAGKPFPFKTCLPAGCLVQFTLEAATVNALKSGKQLKLAIKPVDSTDNKPVIYTVSLKGFGAALDRTAALLK